MPANAQGSEWGWMGGSNANDHGGVYGTLGTPSVDNMPGSRRYASCWTDSKGNFWLFGGDGFDGHGAEGALNDFWRFDPSTSEWTWMGGSSTIGGTTLLSGVPGVYGTLGQPSASNFPGSRTGATSWTDAAGHLWLFGGDGYPAASSTYIDGYLNDLWEYDVASNQWTWMAGSSTVGPSDVSPGVYGTLGTAAATNTPLGRFGAVGWADSSGNLWLFGGGEQPTAGFGYWSYMNDLWRFNPATNEWTWMGGSDTGNQSGVYGVQGTPAAGNVPGGRYFASGWIDASGDLWLFGGQGLVAGGGNLLNDLWEYSPTANQWTWMGGSDILYAPGGQPGVYGTLGQPAATNWPGSRWLTPSWTDSSGNFWLLGGLGFDSAGKNGNLNDLWQFNPATNQWTWMSGSSKLTCVTTPPMPPTCSQKGTYGTQGVPAAANVPGGRDLSGAWTDRSGNLWLFGGIGNDAAGSVGHLNDLWAFQPTSGTLPAATPYFSVAGGTYNSAQTVAISDVTPGATIHYTTDGSMPTAGSTQYATPVTISSTQTLQAIAVAASYANSAAASATYTINLPDFTFAATPSSLTVKSAAKGTVTLSVTPQFGFNSAVTFACSGLAAGASCAFSPATVTPTGAAATTTLTITAETLSAARPGNWPMLLPEAALATAMCLFGLRRRRGMQLVLLVVSLVALGSLPGCGGGGSKSSPPPTPTPITTVVTVTATSGSLHQTATVTLTVD